MNNFRKFRKNAKALSPVVASIILIAVTVAVSIAVAMWMGSLTTGFMDTEEAKITNVLFTTTGANITVANSGISNILISSATVNGDTAVVTSGETLTANEATNIVVLSFDWESGDKYLITLTSSEGNSFSYTKTAS